MINILPKKGRSVARSAYLVRLGAVGTFAGAFIALCTGVLLLPSYVEIRSAAASVEAEQARLVAGGSTDDVEVEAALARAKAEIAAFYAALHQIVPSAPIEAVLRARGSTITLTQIQYDEPGPRMVLTGVAATRETLLSFEQKLRKIPEVSKVDLPVNDLAKSENAHFTITITFTSKTATATSATSPKKQ